MLSHSQGRGGPKHAFRKKSANSTVTQPRKSKKIFWGEGGSPGQHELYRGFLRKFRNARASHVIEGKRKAREA
jgi:hypothetical protein